MSIRHQRLKYEYWILNEYLFEIAKMLGEPFTLKENTMPMMISHAQEIWQKLKNSVNA